MKKILRYVLMLLCLIPSITLADSKYVSSSDNLILNKDYNNSHFAFGQDIDINNHVDGVYVVFGESLKYQTENDYVALFGNRVNVSGKIKDGALFGNNVNLKDIEIDRDIVIFGNRVELSGTFKGNVLIYADTVIINDSNVYQNLSVFSENLSINKNTSVLGNLKYEDGTKVSINSDKINNIIIDNKRVIVNTKDEILDHVYSVIRLLVIFLGMYLLIPKLFDKINNNIGKNFGFGLISFIILPLIFIILLFTNLATSISIIGIMLYVIFIMIAKVLVGYVIGKYLYTNVFKLEEKKYLCGLIGIIILYLLSIIPYIGGWITFASLIYSFGIITNLYLDSRK